jgi:hypothetical protein
MRLCVRREDGRHEAGGDGGPSSAPWVLSRSDPGTRSDSPGPSSACASGAELTSTAAASAWISTGLSAEEGVVEYTHPSLRPRRVQAVHGDCESHRILEALHERHALTDRRRFCGMTFGRGMFRSRE